jgi:outer membrane protein OmpA-like peptidoglycan-associated protein
MAYEIVIPALKNSISVTVGGAFDPDGEHVALEFKGGGMDSKVRVSDRKRRTKLWIKAVLSFPPQYDKATDQTSKHYWQIVEGVFDDIDQVNGQLLFSNTEVKLQGDPLPPEAASESQFRFIDGVAWLSQGNNPRVMVVKIKLTLGSPDVVVVSTTSNTTDPVWKEGGEGGPSGKIEWGPIDVDVKLGLKWERTGQTDSNGKGRTTTVGQLSAQPVWTIYLELPEQKPTPPPPGPFGLPEPYKVYFETGKNNADRYRSPLSGMMDQIKGLQEYMNDIDKAYGLENIESASVIGYASGLGDTRGNINLSAARAQYVAELLNTLYHVEIPRYKITPRGEPINAGDKDDTPEDRRAELMVRIKGSARH